MLPGAGRESREGEGRETAPSLLPGLYQELWPCSDDSCTLPPSPSIALGSAYARYARISEQEMSCLASWREGSARYLVGHLLDAAGTGMEGRNSPWDRSPSPSTSTETASGKDIRCFRYERHGGGTLHMAQSFGGSCMGLWSVDEGARTFKLDRGKIILNLGLNVVVSAKLVKHAYT